MGRAQNVESLGKIVLNHNIFIQVRFNLKSNFKNWFV